MKRRVMTVVLAAALVLAREAAAEEHFVTPAMVDLTILLIAPPAPGSAQAAAELEELRAIQRTRTPERVALARADVEESVWRFADVMGAAFVPERLPRVAALFAILVADVEVVTATPKRGFGRRRPYRVARDLEPACPRPGRNSYPSSHATAGHAMAGILAAMVPERRDAIMARASQFAESRLVCGVHYRSDIEAGRISGIAMAAAALASPGFQEPFAAARAELRAALGLN
jgi:acid phosphatase (class A)